MKKEKRLAKEYKLSDQAQRLADIIAEIGHNRFELRLRGWMPLDWWLSATLAPFIESKKDLSSVLVYQMTFQELLQYLLTGYYDGAELKRRKECVVGGMSAGQVFYRSGDEGRKLAAALVPTVDANIKQLEGQIAQKGYVEGRAYVLHWDTTDINLEMEEMPKGAILVAGQTRPQLMPAIKKAAAIVTDEGGITSHAAIVSRELGIPCVIGTKLATKVIKTGDKIMVDADKGIVYLKGGESDEV